MRAGCAARNRHPRSEFAARRRWLPLLLRTNMRDAKDRAFRLIGFVRQTFDLPAVREDDLADDGEAEAAAMFSGGEIGFENFDATFGRDAGASVGNVDDHFAFDEAGVD